MSDNDDLKACFVRDNGDGTVTWMVPVTVRRKSIDGHEIVAVRKTIAGDHVVDSRGDTIYLATEHDAGWLRIIVRTIPKPQWTPPASLKPGRYRWAGNLVGVSTDPEWPRRIFRDWTDPPAVGWWQVNEDGSSTFEGE